MSSDGYISKNSNTENKNSKRVEAILLQQRENRINFRSQPDNSVPNPMGSFWSRLLYLPKPESEKSFHFD